MKNFCIGSWWGLTAISGWWVKQPVVFDARGKGPKNSPKCLTHRRLIFCVLKFCPSLYLSSSVPVQSLSRVWLFATPWITAHQASLSITNSQSLPKLMSTESVMPSNHLILCHPLLLLPSIPPSIRVFSNESTLCMRWPKYWGCSFSISPSNEYSGPISFRMDWLDLLAVPGTLESHLQHHSSNLSSGKVSVFSHWACC